MRYYYEKYRFDSDTFTLYYNSQPKALKSNEAKLLAFFIENKDVILSKEQILCQIWGEQSVSEQVVFQNISQLRSLFGRNAIKTFPKKGYQWQVAFEANQALPGELVTPSISPQVKPVKHSINYLYIVASLLLLAAVTVIFGLSPQEQLTRNQHSNGLYLIPFSSIGNTEQPQLNNLNHLVAQYSTSNNNADSFSSANTQALFNFPEITKKTLNLANDSIIVSGYLSTYGEQLLVEYKLFGSKRDWSGYLIGQNEDVLSLTLKSTFDGLQDSDYLSEPNSALLSSKLKLLLEQQPNNQSVIYHSILQQISEQNYDVAKALVEKLLNVTKQQPDSPYMALGLFIKGIIYHQQYDFRQALQYYNRSLAQLPEDMLSEIRYKIEISIAWICYEQEFPEQMSQHIDNAAMLALKKNDIQAQISAYTTGSILSHKLGDMVNRYKYLNTAKSLLITHQMAESYFAIIHFHLALFASDKQEAESYYLKVLSLPKLAQYQWLYESATEDLLSWYIEQKQWQAAASLLQSQPKSSFNLNQKAKLLHATNDNAAAIEIAKRAFDQGRLNYQHNNALHAALLLYQLHEELNEVYTPDYQNYISHNASKFWLEKHKEELTKLGYFDGLVN